MFRDNLKKLLGINKTKCETRKFSTSPGKCLIDNKDKQKTVFERKTTLNLLLGIRIYIYGVLKLHF